MSVAEEISRRYVPSPTPIGPSRVRRALGLVAISSIRLLLLPVLIWQLKRLFLYPLHPLALPLTKAIARSLVRFDQFQDRAKDACVSYVGRSRIFRRSAKTGYLACPACGAEYVRRDGLLFLLPRDMDHIRTGYQVAVAATLEKELL